MSDAFGEDDSIGVFAVPTAAIPTAVVVQPNNIANVIARTFPTKWQIAHDRKVAAAHRWLARKAAAAAAIADAASATDQAAVATARSALRAQIKSAASEAVATSHFFSSTDIEEGKKALVAIGVLLDSNHGLLPEEPSIRAGIVKGLAYRTKESVNAELLKIVSLLS